MPRWWRWVSMSNRIFQNIFDDNSLICSWNAQNFLLSIMLCLMNDRFKRLCIAICCSDIDYRECCLSRIFLLRSLLLRMTMIELIRWVNSWLQIVVRTCEMCRVSSLIAKDSIDKLLWIFSWLYKDQFICDQAFWTNARFKCFWWIIRSCRSIYIQMSDFFFYLRVFFAHSDYLLTFAW